VNERDDLSGPASGPARAADDGPTHDRAVAAPGDAADSARAPSEWSGAGLDVGADITPSDPVRAGVTAPASDDLPEQVDLTSGEGQPLRKVVEAILVVADQPVTDVEIAQVTERPTAAVCAVLADLAAGYAADGRGFTLREVAGGWRLYSAPDCSGYVERFVLEGQQARLTQAALETLAVVAYRQPVTRASIAAIRGVNVEGVIRTLQARGLVEEVGQETSGAVLYGTTTYFLSRLGLNSLDELPSLAPFLPIDIDSIAEQL
jgi:segregation and condensation protein B